MIITDQRFVAGEEDDLVPVVLFKGRKTSAGIPWGAMAKFSPLDIIAMDNYNISVLRREIVRTIPVAVRIRKISCLL